MFAIIVSQCTAEVDLLKNHRLLLRCLGDGAPKDVDTAQNWVSNAWWCRSACLLQAVFWCVPFVVWCTMRACASEGSGQSYALDMPVTLQMLVVLRFEILSSCYALCVNSGTIPSDGGGAVGELQLHILGADS